MLQLMWVLNTMNNNHERDVNSPKHWQITAAFGVFFIALAVLIALVSNITWWSVAAVVIIGLLGVDALFSAIRNTPSLLSRIGPLL